MSKQNWSTNYHPAWSENETPRAPADTLSRINSRGMVRNFETHPIRNVKTPAQEFREFCAKLDKLSARPDADDAALMARLRALPEPSWMQAMKSYTTHEQRMRAFYRELDKDAKPLTWRPISAERAAELANETAGGSNRTLALDFDADPAALTEFIAEVGVPSHLWGKSLWPERHRDKVVRAAVARGDAFSTFPQLSVE